MFWHVLEHLILWVYMQPFSYTRKVEKVEKIAVERSIWINAPRQQVWNAVTDPEQFAKWFLPAMPGSQVKRDDQGKLSLSMGPMVAEFAIFEVMEPPQKVVSRSLPDKLFATTYTFDEENGGTRVTVAMTGFETLPEDARHDRLNLSGTHWEKALENLNAHVAGAELPHPYAAVAPLFGYWREAKDKLAVERSVWINAPRERVWHAITDPDQIEMWFSPGTKWRGTGLHVGGRVSVYDPETDTESYTQVIEVVDPPNQLVTRSEVVPPEIPYVTDWRLVEENGGTRLFITHTGYELDTDDSRWMKMDQNAFGYGMMLDNLRAVAEGEPVPFPGGF